ncbi:MAG TPA: acyl carrier protein phosphodiesterase, partial [Flavobacterium sp.]|nr:acyl carrier protein phosphodiesterase [Flavobacterium sp.]
HPVFRQSTKRLHQNYHHYAGVIVDIFYDHFLAKNWSHYSEENLENYTSLFYQSLHNNYEFLSDKTKQILPYIEKQNWLLSYQTIEGIQQILTQMDRRTKNSSNMRFASEELRTHYADFEKEFTLFFEEIKNYCAQKINTL